MVGENWEFWLNMTNIALGVVIILALVLVFGTAARELWARWAHQARATSTVDAKLRMKLHAASHSLSVPELGLTMADGGERVEPSEPQASDERPRRK